MKFSNNTNNANNANNTTGVDVFGGAEAFSPKGLDEEGYRALEDDDVPF